MAFVRDAMGNFITIDDPNATRHPDSSAQGINDAGQIVGFLR